jgi:large conductance mechanosensitive channel
MLKEFREFIARANAIDLAVAVILGVAFGKIVTSLVDGVLMPPIGLLLGKADFSSLFLVLDHSKGQPVSLAEAKAKAIPVIAYGAFLNDIVNFLIVALVVFLLIKTVNKMRKKDAAVKDCPFCYSAIPIKATVCSGCCSQLEAA